MLTPLSLHCSAATIIYWMVCRALCTFGLWSSPLGQSSCSQPASLLVVAIAVSFAATSRCVHPASRSSACATGGAAEFGCGLLSLFRHVPIGSAHLLLSNADPACNELHERRFKREHMPPLITSTSRCSANARQWHQAQWAWQSVRPANLLTPRMRSRLQLPSS